MVEMNRNFYNPSLAHMVPQHKLEIWPGYVTAVAEYEGGLMLNLVLPVVEIQHILIYYSHQDVSHKVLRSQTAYDLVSSSSSAIALPDLILIAYMQIMDCLARKGADPKADVLKALLGAVVITRYNNKTYKVDDIDWTETPSSTFIDENGRKKSFIDYYREKYNLVIEEKKQPMLVSRAKRKTKEEEDIAKTIFLVPELCNMTGLTDQMKSNFKVMKDVAQFTRVTPMQRQEVLHIVLHMSQFIIVFCLLAGSEEVHQERQ